MGKMKDPELAIENMRVNMARKHLPFIGATYDDQDFVPVCGGPSIRSRFKEIRARQKIGGQVVACNGARRLLLDNGIKPNMVAFCDPSPVVCGFLDEPDDSIYLVASCCHPSVFDKLEGCKVVMWHPDNGFPEQKEILAQYPEIPSVLIGGGNTIGLRMLNIGYALGYRKFHFYGLDSSYADDGADHAYAKHDGPEPEKTWGEFEGKIYWGSPWMHQQGELFMSTFYPQFIKSGCKIFVHGEGLIPDMCRSFNEYLRQAA